MTSNTVQRSVRCACGAVELLATGPPIMSTSCYCDDCQEGSRRISSLANAPTVLDPDSGTPYVLFRKDRVAFVKGADHLRDYRIRDESPTKRVVATCCNSAMFLDFTKGHWLSIYRARFDAPLPPVEMRIQTKHKRSGTEIPRDTPSYAAFPLNFIAKLLIARVAMLFRL